MDKKQLVMNDLYDLIRVCGLPEKQDDEWARLSRLYGDEAKKNFKKLLKNKTIEINDYKTIKIGKDITLTIN